MVDVARLAAEARKYRQALPVDSDDQLRRFQWDVIDRKDTGFRYVDRWTEKSDRASSGCFSTFSGIGLYAYVLFVLPVQFRNWSVRPTYDRRVAEAVQSSRVAP
jgi:hypothetical protein